MITGHNTDVEHGGVVYHIQTEDKGLDTPVILSLVYSGGAILASKRSPYDDLIEAGFDEAVLTERLDRQHKLICAAIHSGRLEDLKKMSEREPAGKHTRRKASRLQEPVPDTTKPAEETVATPTDAEAARAESAQDRFPIADSAAEEDLLQVGLLEDIELRGGESVTLRVFVSRGSGDDQQPVKNARVVVKTLGSSFRPSSLFSTTDRAGVAPFDVSLPDFKEGRAAILVRAEIDGETAELRRIILPG